MHSPSVDVRGYDMIPISEHSADSWAPEDSQRTLNSGIVENRVKLSHKDHQRHGAGVGCNSLGWKC